MTLKSPAPIDTTIVVMETRWLDDLPRVRALVRRCVAATLKTMRIRMSTAGVSLSVALAADRQVRVLNRDHRGKDAPTNVLSYPDTSPRRRGQPRQLGDIVLALQTVRREARTQRKTFEHHVAHLVVHGVLHLLGHDHMNDREASAMETIEVEVLAGLGIANPYRLR